MKKELFEKMVLALRQYNVLTESSVSEKDSYITYSFVIRTYTDPSLISDIKADIRKPLPYCTSVTKFYLTILYNKETDKISVSEFEVGWKWSVKKERWFPFRKSTPIFTYSKHPYIMFNGGGRLPLMVRILTGHHCALYGVNSYMAHLFRIALETKIESPLLPVSYRFYKGAQTEWDVIKNYTGITIPKALTVFAPADVLRLLLILKNPGELNMLCQRISEAKQTWPLVLKDEPYDLWSFLSKIMLGIDSYTWLIRDWANDHMKLKRKTSLKISSKTRIEDEHRKMSKEIMIQGIKEIKVHEDYVKEFDNFPIPGAELITTKERLLQESVDMDHCVATYGNYINNGTCCIIAFEYKSIRYTLEMRKADTTNKYYVAQLRGVRNAPAPTEVYNLLEKYALAGNDLPF